MTDYQSVLHVLFLQEYMKAEEIAQMLFSGSLVKTYKNLAELQKRHLITSIRVQPERGGSSPKIYKITTKGVKSILPQLESEGVKFPQHISKRSGKPETDLRRVTPNFPNTSDSMKRKLIIEQLQKNTEIEGGAFFSGQEAMEAVIHFIARLTNVTYRQASRIFQFNMKEFLVMPPEAKQPAVKPMIYFIPTVAAGQPYIIDRLGKYTQAERYLEFRVIPITEMQIYMYPNVTEIKNMATIINAEKLLPTKPAAPK